MEKIIFKKATGSIDIVLVDKIVSIDVPMKQLHTEFYTVNVYQGSSYSVDESDVATILSFMKNPEDFGTKAIEITVKDTHSYAPPVGYRMVDNL